MTIDEAIAHEKIDSEPCSILCTHTTNRNDCIECRAYHKQLAERLEELKELREKNETLKALYENVRKEGNNLLKRERNKAIDDLLGGMNQITYNCQDADELFEKICDLAEQLKVGGKNDNLRK